MKALPDINLWTDTIYHCSLHLSSTPLPMKPVTAQKSWRDNMANRVRWQLRDMLPHDFRIVEGVEVRKVSHKGSGIVYKVNREGSSLGLATAVSRVCQIASEREAG